MSISTKVIIILLILLTVSFESNRKIAKLVGISQNSVDYRIKKLKQKGIITNFSAIINTEALNKISFTMKIKFNKGLQKFKEIEKFFINHPLSNWISTISGNYDLFIEFIIEDLGQMQKIITEIREHFQEDLNNYKIHICEKTLRVEHLIKDLYIDLNLPELLVKKRDFSSKKLDRLDKQILNIISNDSEKNFVEIAKQINSTWDVIRYRIKQMENAGIILKYFPEINLKKLGYLNFICEINLHNFNTEDLKNISNLTKENNNVTYSFLNMNSTSLIVTCSFKSIEV